MATFISLINWTDQGIRDVRSSVERASAADELARKHGGELTHVHWTIGQYDLVAISEFPDAEAATAFALTLGSLGNIRTTTLRAFDADEMREIIGRVG